MVESGTPIKFSIPIRNNKSNIFRCDISLNFNNTPQCKPALAYSEMMKLSYKKHAFN